MSSLHKRILCTCSTLLKRQPPPLQDGHVQVAALHQGSLTWPPPVWLLPAAPGTHSRHRTREQTHLAQTEPTASTSGRSAATSSESDTEELSGSSSSSSSSCSSHDEIASISASIGNARVQACCAPVDLVPSAAAGDKKSRSIGTEATAGTVSRSHDGHIRTSENAGDDSSSSASDCDSHGSSESDSDSEDAKDAGTATQIGVLGNGSQQQTAFDQLDMLFSRKGAAGSMSTQLAALDLLKHKPGQSVHSVVQSAGGKTQHGLLCKGPARLPADKPSIKTRKGLPKQRLLAGEDGRKAIAKTEWVQMQKGGNPVYSNQRAGGASAGER